jgi:hypothetical protein
MNQIAVNGFSLAVSTNAPKLYPTNIPNGIPLEAASQLHWAKKRVIDGANYFLMRHNSTYKLNLTNDRSTKCDAEVWIDGEKVGVWRIEAYGSTIIERPATINRKFVFLRENSSRAHSAGIQSGRSDNGLIKVVFKPARSDFLTRPWESREWNDRGCFTDFLNPSQQEFYGAAFSDRMLYNNNTNQQNYAQNANVNYQFAAPLQSCLSGCSPAYSQTYSHGATALGQRSNQDFDTTAPIRDVDTANVTTIMARLLVDNDLESKPLVSLRDALHGTKYPSRLNVSPTTSLESRKIILFS